MKKQSINNETNFNNNTHLTIKTNNFLVNPFQIILDKTKNENRIKNLKDCYINALVKHLF